jgi:hypothetical protein
MLNCIDVANHGAVSVASAQGLPVFAGIFD